MKSKLISTVTAITLLAAGAALPVSASGLAAFPGAEGGGMYATGGRGGRVVHVTNLNDSGTGSFRDAVSGSGRIVVFDVGGTVNLKSDVVVKGNVTILGQTAPGGHGITLRGGKLGMGGDNTIIRFISSRPGETGAENDGWGGSAGSNSIVDHCSIGWANDEMWGLYSNNMNQTVQYTIVGPANCISVHDKGAHGFGVMLGKGQNSWHHNLIAHNISRNFRGKIEGTNGFDFVNNVIYDWGYETAYGTLGHLNYVNNYLKAGNSTRGSHRFINRSSGSNYEKFRFYITGNTLRNVDGSVYSSEIDADNWKGVSGFDGVTLDDGTVLGEALNRVNTPNKVTASDGSSVSVAANAESAEDAFLHVTSYAGAAIDAASRTRIDNEVLGDALNGTGYLTGGRKFSQVTESALLEAISKYGIKEADYDSYYPEATSKTITDSDNDGMPDEWEIARGLDPNSASDATGDYLGQGYNNIEYYANDLTVNAFPAGVVTLSPETSALGQEYTNAKEDIDAVQLSPTSITEASQLTLPQTGSKHGLAIAWSSSSSAIKISGNTISAVNRPTGDTAANVTLTATIENGGYTLKKTFTITVPSRSLTWIPSSDAAAGSELMEGLTCISDVSVAAGKNYTINGETLTTSANCGKGNWSKGAVTGGGLKFTAPETGFLSVYVPSLSNTSNGGARMVYMTEEGKTSREDCTASISSYDGAFQMLLGYVEAGHTYYVFLAGGTTTVSKVSFAATAPLRWWKASADVEQGGEPMKGLAASEAMTYTANAQTIDGESFTGSVSGSSNPGGTPKGATGAAFRYTPDADGRLTIYYKLNSTKTFMLTDANGELLENYENTGENTYTSSTLTLNGGETYYMYVNGSKAAFYGAAFEQTGAYATAKPEEEEEPTPTPDPYAAPTPIPAPAAVTAAESDFSGEGNIISSTKSNEAITNDEISGMKLYVGPRTNGPDTSTLFKYADGGVSGTALLMQSGAYATVNRGPRFIITKPQVSGNNVITASFKAKPADENSLLRYNDLLYEDNAGKPSYAQDLGLTTGEWNDVRVVITEKNGETTRQIFVNGVEKATDGNAEFPVFWGSQTNGAKLYIDDLKVTTQELPGATIAVAQGRAYTDSTGVPVKAWAATMALNGSAVNRIVWEIDVDGVKKYAIDETASISGASEIKLGLIIEADTADEAGIAQINRLGAVSAEAQ